MTIVQLKPWVVVVVTRNVAALFGGSHSLQLVFLSDCPARLFSTTTMETSKQLAGLSRQVFSIYKNRHLLMLTDIIVFVYETTSYFCYLCLTLGHPDPQENYKWMVHNDTFEEYTGSYLLLVSIKVQIQTKLTLFLDVGFFTY